MESVTEIVAYIGKPVDKSVTIPLILPFVTKLTVMLLDAV